MVERQLSKGRLEQRRIEILLQLQKRRLIPVVLIGVGLLKEPPLNRRQRDFASNQPLLKRGGVAVSATNANSAIVWC